MLTRAVATPCALRTSSTGSPYSVASQDRDPELGPSLRHIASKDGFQVRRSCECVPPNGSRFSCGRPLSRRTTECLLKSRARQLQTLVRRHPLWNSVSEIPKSAREPDAGDERLGFFHRVPSPFRFQFILVPAMRELPALLRCEGRAALDVPGLAPTIDMLFCTEEEHRAS